MGLKVRLQEKKVPLTSLKLDGIGSTEGNASSDGSSDDPTTTTTEENTSDHGSGDDTTTTTTTEENTSNDGSSSDDPTTSHKDQKTDDPKDSPTDGNTSDLGFVASRGGKLKSRAGRSSTVDRWAHPSQIMNFETQKCSWDSL